ncbi:outer membrane protein assembly factor BamA [bacterium]|nr:outer membrane protein assembly factor BamA [bacterium]MCP5462791.1 outer membrane protein assembly factor BamA [bacterium]
MNHSTFNLSTVYSVTANFLRTKFIVAVTMLSLVFISFPLSSEEEGELISSVTIKGLKTLTTEFVLAKINSRKGAYFYATVMKEDIKRLYATGHFAMINFETAKSVAGIDIFITVEEKPILTKIEFLGNAKIKTHQLVKEVKSKVGSRSDEGRINLDTQAIRELYIKKGFPLVEIDYSLSIDAQKNEATLTFTIDEGSQLRVNKISFEGVTAFPQKTLLKLMKTKKTGLWPFYKLFKTGILDEEVFGDDLERLEGYYNFKGYLDARIVEVKRIPHPKKNRIELIIVIEEGPTYNVGTYEISGNAVFPTRSLQELVTSTPGSLYSPEKREKDIQSMRDFYYDRGYIEAQIIAKVAFDPQTNAMNIHYKIEESGIFYVDKVSIQGNFKTKDKVIRRELLVIPGEVFNGSKIRTSQTRLQNTGFFEEVKALIEASEEQDKKTLVFDVKEKKTGSLSFGAGFSSIDSFIGFAEVGQSNFDIFNFENFQGAGQKLRFRFEGGDKRTNFLISFVEPYFLDKKVVFGFDAFLEESRYLSDDYDEDKGGVSFRLGKAIDAVSRGEVIVTIERVGVNVEDDASPELLMEDGDYNQVSVALKYDYDTRDRIVLPRRGRKTVAILKASGGTEGYARFDARNTNFFTPFSEYPEHIIQVIMAMGVADGLTGGGVPIFDRFFLGGPNNVRGFEFREIGPQDINDESLGGELSLWSSIEYLYPIIERVHGAVFIDWGNVYASASDLSDGAVVGAGLGMRLMLPIGPIKLDYGFPIVTDDNTDDAKPRFHFSLGTSF